MNRPWHALVAGLAAATVAGCATMPTRGTLAAADVTPASHDELLRLGAQEFSAGRLERARGYFRYVLKYDPRNAKAHTALAATFDVDASGGDRTQRDLAKVGYAQALKFDARNWLAAHRLGVLEIEDDEIPSAIEHLSLASSLRRDDPQVLDDLARALYLDGRVTMARAVVERAIEKGATGAPVFRRAALIAAAGGDSAQATAWKARFEAERPTAAARDALSLRLDDWRIEHARLARPTVPADATRAATSQAQGTAPGVTPALRSPFFTPGNAERTTTTLAPLPPLQAGARARMVQVDLMIIRTEEIETRRRGTNLMRSLQLQFGADARRTLTRSGAEGASLDGSESQTLAQQLSIPALTYSLDIANTAYDRSDVLARPTLVALDGQPASVFVGEELSIPVTSQLSSSLSDKTVGIDIAVTPTFVDDNTVLLSVSASRSFLNTAFIPQANTALRTTQQRVTTAVVADFGKTVVLSGLTEREANTSREGVPVLQELPGIQYLFSSQATLAISRSVMIALTPRLVGHAQPSGNPEEGPFEVIGLQQVETYFPDLTKRMRALAQVSHDLSRNAFRSLLSQDDMAAAEPLRANAHWSRLAQQLQSLLIY